jgi:RND superfamily putative drug exporter
VLRHRALVVLVWVVLAVAGGVTAPKTVDSLSYDFGLPGQPAYEANQQILSDYGSGGQVDPLILMVRLPAGTTVADSGVGEDFEAVVEQITRAVPGARVATPQTTGAKSLVSADKRTLVAVVYPEVVPGADPYVAALPAIQAAAAKAKVERVPVQVTGVPVLQSTSSGGDRGVLVEIIFGATGALIILALVFGSLLAIVPLVIAAVAILTTFLCLLGLTQVTDVIFVVQFLVGLIGLGVAIDYSLLIVMRWREERANGADNDQAVRTAVETAGHSVVFSGVTVAVSLAALIVVPLPFLRSIGLGGLLIPLLSVATATTLLPVILHTIGPKLSWPRRRVTDPTSRRWGSAAGWVVRHRVFVAVASVVVLLAMAAPLLGIRLGSPELAAYGSSTPAARAVSDLVADGIAPGVLRPTEIVALTTDVKDVQARVAKVPGVAQAVIPDATGWSKGGTTLVQVWTTTDPATAAGSSTLAAIRAAMDATTSAQVGGSPAEDADFVTAVYSKAPWVIVAIVVVTFVLLARALRSLWLPVKALLLNVVSISAAYGLTVLIWQHGVGTQTLFSTTASGTITTWVPIAVFAFLFGLSMDYEVFILSRMREFYDQHGSTDRAVVAGIASTGRLVTSAALILFLSFVALSTVPSVDVKILATALALGIAIDALIVRTLLTPALVSLLGRFNWTLPDLLRRLLVLAPEAPAVTSTRPGRHRAS